MAHIETYRQTVTDTQKKCLDTIKKIKEEVEQEIEEERRRCREEIQQVKKECQRQILEEKNKCREEFEVAKYQFKKECEELKRALQEQGRAIFGTAQAFQTSSRPLPQSQPSQSDSGKKEIALLKSENTILHNDVAKAFVEIGTLKLDVKNLSYWIKQSADYIKANEYPIGASEAILKPLLSCIAYQTKPTQATQQTAPMTTVVQPEKKDNRISNSSKSAEQKQQSSNIHSVTIKQVRESDEILCIDCNTKFAKSCFQDLNVPICKKCMPGQ